MTEENKATVYYKDIGDYLSREEKLAVIRKAGSIDGVDWTVLYPNEHGDWITQRNEKFSTFIPIEPDKKFNNKAQSFFNVYSLGVATNKDVWLYNSSREKLKENTINMVNYYNTQRKKLNSAKKENLTLKAKDFVNYDATKITWTDMFLHDADQNITYNFSDDTLCDSMYRPFFKQQLVYEKQFIQRTYQQLKLFPTPKHQNLLISVHGLGGKKEFSTLITNLIPDLNSLEAGAQCFPLYWYEKVESQNNSLFEQEKETYIRHDAVTDFILDQAKEKYGNKVSKEDIFYYVYGILHSKTYRKIFAADLKKMLPRLPLVSKPQTFWDFSRAGRTLAKLHIEYETVEPYPDVIVTGTESKNFSVQQMKFPKKGQKDTILYNSCITVSNIPEKAYEYVVNGKSAIEWIMERYAVTTDKDSGITNDANDWGKEHGNERYILDLLLSVINVSVQTVDIVNALPEVDWEKE